MEVEKCVLDWSILLSEDDSADITAIVSGYGKINTLDDPSIDGLFPRTNSIDVVLVSAGSDDSTPSSLEGLL